MKWAFLVAFLAVANSGAAKTWKVDVGTSVDEVNSWAVKPGDAVLFRRGGTWNGTLRVRSGESGRPVVYGAFGEGPKPLLTQCVDASGTNHWRRTFIKGLNALWETSPELSAALDADVGGLIGDTGPIMEGQTDDALFSKVDESAKLTGEKLFWYDAGKRRVVVRRFNTPDRLLGKVKLTLAKPIVDLSGRRHVVVDGLALRFGGADGFLGLDVEDVAIRNCDVSYVGGGMRDGARSGSCIALGGNVRTCLLERNRLWQAYGAAVSVGEQGAGEVKDVVCRDNAVWKCMNAFRFGDAPASVSEVTLEFNTCVDTGFAWAMFGPSGGKRLAAARILSLNLPEATAGFAVRSNVFYRTMGIAVENRGKGKFSLDGNRYWLPQEWGHVDNAVYSEPASDLLFKCGAKNFRSFREKTGFEKNGEFARPSFTDETRKDFRPYHRAANAPGVRGVPGIDEDQSMGNGGVYSTETLRSGIWSLKMDGRDAFVMRARARWNSPSYPGGEYAFANLEAHGAAKLTVKVHDGRDLSNVMIQPAGAPVEPRHVDAHTLELSVARPCKFTVEPDDNRVAPLFVFVNPPERDIPDANDPNVVFFGPGIHRVPGDLVQLRDGQTLYVARGAVLQAAVRATGANVRICGRGVIDGSIFPHTWGRKGPQYAFVNFFKCRDLVMEDVTLLGSFHWTIYPEGCDRVTIRNVKLCGDRCCNDDGIDPSNTRDLLMENCFFRTQDDSVAVKGIEMKNGPCERITVTNSIFWCDFARIVCIGHESRAPYMDGIRFVDNDVLHYVRPLLLVEPGDNMPVSNVVFRNVRVHTDLHGRTEATMRIQPVVNDYTQTKTPGTISGVAVDDLTFTGTPIPLRFNVRGHDATRVTRDVSFANITVNGKRMTERASARPGSYLADDIWFDGENHPGPSDPMFVRGPHVDNVRVESADAGERVLFDAEAGVGAAAVRDGVFRLEGAWDISRFGTVEMTLAAGAAGKNIASVKFFDAEGGVFAADVNFYGREAQTREWEIPPYYPEWRRTARAIDAVPFGKGKSLGRWGLDWRIWPTTRWHWYSGFYFDNVHLVKYTIDAARVSGVEVRLSGETYGDAETGVRDWRMLRIVLKDAPRVSPNPPKYATMKSEEFFPFVDRYGQFRWEDWPEKIRSDADLVAAREREAKDLAAHPGPSDWDKWGGWAKGPRLEATGHFRTEKWNGKWWFVDPDGRLWWSHGAVRLTPSSAQTCIKDGRENWFEWLPAKDAPEAAFYWTRDELMWPYHVIRNVTNTFDFSSCNIARKYGADWFGKWADVCHRRLRSWGANTIANSSDVRLARMDRTPYCDRFELKSRPLAGALGKICWWPFRDPWDPSFRADIRRNLAAHKAELEDPWCFGFFVDNELQWGWTMRCAVDAFESGADQPAKRELVNGLKAKYGDVAKLNAAWGADFADWRAVLARTKPLADYRRAQRDLEAFAVRMAEAYFSQIRDEFKKAAPHKLYLGCRFSGADAAAIRVMEKYADVMSFNIYTPDLSDFVVNAIGTALKKPVIVGEWAVSGSMERGNFTAHNVMRRSQAERAEQYRRYVESALHHPDVIGVHWHQFMDPATASGRYDGLTKQAGWVDMCDTPYWELVEAVRDVGHRMYALRAGGGR